VCFLELNQEEAIMDYSGGVLAVYGPNETAPIFATYPSNFLSLGSSFLDQVRSGRVDNLTTSDHPTK